MVLLRLAKEEAKVKAAEAADLKAQEVAKKKAEDGVSCGKEGRSLETILKEWEMLGGLVVLHFYLPNFLSDHDTMDHLLTIFPMIMRSPGTKTGMTIG